MTTSTRDQAAEFFRKAGDSSWYHASQATFALGMLALVWFFVGVTALLRRVEGEPAWRSTAALLSGTLFVAVATVADVSWVAAAHHGSETHPTVALFAFDVGNIGLATAWVGMAGFAWRRGAVAAGHPGPAPVVRLVGDRDRGWAGGGQVHLGVRLLVPAVLGVLGRCRLSRRPPARARQLDVVPDATERTQG